MDNRHRKEKRAIDLLPDDPQKAIADTLYHYDVDHIIREMHTWFYIAISHECSAYENTDERAGFIEFYEDLLSFIEAVYALKYKEHPKSTTAPQYIWEHITSEQVNDPMMVIRRFCYHYPPMYVRLEMWDFFQAIQFYHGPLKEKIYQHDTSCLHQSIQLLIDGYYLILGITSK